MFCGLKCPSVTVVGEPVRVKATLDKGPGLSAGAPGIPHGICPWPLHLCGPMGGGKRSSGRGRQGSLRLGARRGRRRFRVLGAHPQCCLSPLCPPSPFLRPLAVEVAAKRCEEERWASSGGLCWPLWSQTSFQYTRNRNSFLLSLKPITRSA